MTTSPSFSQIRLIRFLELFGASLRAGLTDAEREEVAAVSDATLYAVCSTFAATVAPIEYRLAATAGADLSNAAIYELHRRGLSPREIEIYLAAYYRGNWKTDRHRDTPPSNSEAYFFWIALKGRPSPVKKRQIINIINDFTVQSARRPDCTLLTEVSLNHSTPDNTIRNMKFERQEASNV